MATVRPIDETVSPTHVERPNDEWQDVWTLGNVKTLLAMVLVRLFILAAVTALVVLFVARSS